jgi:NADH:ubiquinone oxidoreductase subunit K
VLGVFLLTLAAAAADSYIGLGLGTITLVALTAGSVVATLAVRRRDLLSVVVCPPLVFVAVAVLNIGLAPSATLSLPTLATLLVRGFPAMGLATAVALVLAVFRLIARR